MRRISTIGLQLAAATDRQPILVGPQSVNYSSVIWFCCVES